jgi:UDP-N-acetylmuramoyl-L-alanyl-D-glutamate--2,6-diaminopimelate ligase
LSASPAATIASTIDWLRERGVTELITDSRKLTLDNASKTAFIAWPGAAVDGRAFIPEAIQNGAVAALMELEDAPKALLDMASSGYPIKVCAGLKAASGEIAAEFYGRPSQQLRIVAITGTNGKTSSSWWLAQALSTIPAPYTEQCAVVGTLGTGCIGAIENNGLTTPDPVLLQARLKAFISMGCGAVSLEASSIGIVEGRLNGARIHTAVFTNFTQDHLDYHGTMEAYWQAKASLFDWPHLQAACVNLDDAQGLALMDRLADKPLDVWTFATEREAIIMAKNITVMPLGLAFDVTEGSESYHLQTPLVGRYNVCNLLGVIAAMRSLGIPLSLCSKACETITPVPGRLEVVSRPSEPLTLIDYAHTPDALEKALTTLREVTTKRGGALWCVFGCGGNRDATKRPVMGAIAKRFADKVVITSDNPRSESASSIVAHILLGTGEDAHVQVQIDRALAIEQTIAQANTNDVIVIAGKGHEDYQEIAGVKSPFSDQLHATAALVTWGKKS